LETVVAQYSARLSFEFLMTGASVVEVSVTGEVPERDADFINGLCDEFLADNLSRKNDAAIKTIEFINDQLAQLSDSLRLSEDRLKAYKADNFVVASAGGNTVMSQYSKIDDCLPDPGSVCLLPEISGSGYRAVGSCKLISRFWKYNADTAFCGVGFVCFGKKQMCTKCKICRKK
jgi:hypothetical protein